MVGIKLDSRAKNCIGVQSFAFGLDQPSVDDPHSATDLNIEIESARLVKKAFALTP